MVYLLYAGRSYTQILVTSNSFIHSKERMYEVSQNELGEVQADLESSPFDLDQGMKNP